MNFMMQLPRPRITQPILVAGSAFVGVLGLIFTLGAWSAISSISVLGMMLLIVLVVGFVGALLPPIAVAWQVIIGLMGGFLLSAGYATVLISRI